MRRQLGILSLFLCSCLSSQQLFEKYVIEGYGDAQHGWRRASGAVELNPNTADQRSIENGRQIFQTHCAVCHGKEGRGDGEYARSLNPQPANLQKTATEKPEYFIYLQISEGREGMPNGSRKISSTDRWDVVNFILSLEP